MCIFEKIRIRLINGRSRLITVFGIPIVQYDVIKFPNKKKRKIYFPLIRKYKSYSSNPDNARENVFYLKVNLEYNYADIAIRHWLNVINEMDGDFYIVCDKKNLKKKILEKYIFKNSNIKFIKSIRKPLKKLIKKITTKNWRNAGYAHLTTFYHAKKMGINNYWNIDADDTTLVISPKKTVEVLKQVELDAKERNIDITSLDMWRSRSRGVQWTFGVTYTRNNDKFVQIFDNADSEWKKKYFGLDNGLNVDWFITYLHDNKRIKAESFYIENMYFIHWCRDGNFISNPLGSYVCQWHDGIITYPILKYLFQNNNVGEIPIFSDIRKYDCNITDEDGLSMFQNSVSSLKWTRKELVKLWHVKLR